MIDFLIYLTPQSSQIISMLYAKNYKILENAPICRNKEIFGFLYSKNFIVCTNNIKNTISPVDHYVNETVYHEAVHAIQNCKGGPINIKEINLETNKLNDVNNSVKLTGVQPVYETEAYYLEDKPDQIISYMKRYCF